MDIVYGSPTYGGIGLRNLYIEQGIAKVNILFRHIRENKDLSKILRINLEWTQLLCGISGMILEKVTPKINYVNNWFMDLREFLHYINGSITTTFNYQSVSPLRQNDTFIMEKIIQYEKSTTILETINRVRLWLQVPTIAEITNAAGTQIERQYWKGDKQNDTDILWPCQSKPNEHAFKLWRKGISTIFKIE